MISTLSEHTYFKSESPLYLRLVKKRKSLEASASRANPVGTATCWHADRRKEHIDARRALASRHTAPAKQNILHTKEHVTLLRESNTRIGTLRPSQFFQRCFERVRERDQSEGTRSETTRRTQVVRPQTPRLEL